ncbi:DUF1428 domain-containing protein [Kaistia adipata]|uniref:DUF1428 domain-containing protein n=1 Tax=Kaistia adipata TaxID=166954 RepID=UPI0004257DF0|nr:DUF1428 family protein [Kaistia adipata]
MTYVEGFVTAVPAANKEAYRQHAAEAAAVFREFGMTRMVEGWGDDVPDGKVTDFRRAVAAEDGEVVLFSWFEYPDRAARDAANEKIMSDPRMQAMSETMPFDARRMIFGGFQAILEDGGESPGMGYLDGTLIAVPKANKEAYRAMAALTTPVVLEHGATRVVETWADDVPDGKVTDFRRAVQAKDDETVVYSWIEWPSKEARVAGWEKVMADPRMRPDAITMPFDGQRMIYGGFAPILDLRMERG